MTRNDVLNERNAVLRTLAYFDVFKYPLTAAEVVAFCDSPLSPGRAEEVLHELIEAGTIAGHDGFHGFGDLIRNVEERRQAEGRAQARMAKAYRMSRFIGRFPFVRGVMLSGSISKGVLAKDGDIDYFVITEPGRLWIARTLLIAFKKLFLFNSRRDFCVNYFVDTEHLAIEDRNRFTATEVLTLVPTFNPGLCRDFFVANSWAIDVLPNKSLPRVAGAPFGHGVIKRATEALMRNGLGDELDEWCMLRTLHRWRYRFAEFDRRKFDLALRTRRYVSKHHPRNFQERVLSAFQERVERLVLEPVAL
jgi:hypothetical protein